VRRLFLLVALATAIILTAGILASRNAGAFVPLCFFAGAIPCLLACLLLDALEDASGVAVDPGILRALAVVAQLAVLVGTGALFFAIDNRLGKIFIIVSVAMLFLLLQAARRWEQRRVAPLGARSL
jgi:hypothetical protein